MLIIKTIWINFNTDSAMPVIVQKYLELLDTVSKTESPSALQNNQIHRANFTWLEDNAVVGDCKYYNYHMPQFSIKTFCFHLFLYPRYSFQRLVVTTTCSAAATHIVVI